MDDRDWPYMIISFSRKDDKTNQYLSKCIAYIAKLYLHPICETYELEQDIFNKRLDFSAGGPSSASFVLELKDEKNQARTISLDPKKVYWVIKYNAFFARGYPYYSNYYDKSSIFMPGDANISIFLAVSETKKVVIAYTPIPAIHLIRVEMDTPIQEDILNKRLEYEDVRRKARGEILSYLISKCKRGDLLFRNMRKGGILRKLDK